MKALLNIIAISLGTIAAIAMFLSIFAVITFLSGVILAIIKASAVVTFGWALPIWLCVGAVAIVITAWVSAILSLVAKYSGDTSGLTNKLYREVK